MEKRQVHQSDKACLVRWLTNREILSGRPKIICNEKNSSVLSLRREPNRFEHLISFHQGGRGHASPGRSRASALDQTASANRPVEAFVRPVEEVGATE
jgi:hypothetical protein